MKQAKIPPITAQTKFLCFDLETNGLHGQAFAVGALVIDMQKTVHETFEARTEIDGEVDEMVKTRILPILGDMPVTHDSYEEMREAFWKWFIEAQDRSDYVLVSNGYPVEYRFLLDCQNADLENRYWQHPFPLIELSSLLLGLGQLTNIKKKELLAKASSQTFANHHPFHDAKATALIAIEALSQKL